MKFYVERKRKQSCFIYIEAKDEEEVKNILYEEDFDWEEKNATDDFEIVAVSG